MSEERVFGPVRLIPGANKGRYPHSNSVYVDGSGILIDAGADEARYRDFWRRTLRTDFHFKPRKATKHFTPGETIASVRRLQQVPAKVWLTSHEDGCFEDDATEAFFEWGEGAIMGKHLERLMQRGTVVLEDGRYRRVA